METTEEIKVKYSRFKTAPWFPKENTYALIGGAGGIGSWLALLLVRAGFKIFIYDFDLVEEHNIGGQLYGHTHISEPKVVALANVIDTFCGENIMYFNEKVDDGTPTNEIVFSAFDNLEARKMLYRKWKNNLTDENMSKAIFIDGHLAAEQITIYCILGTNVSDQDTYETEYLSTREEEIEDAPCTMKQTSHVAAIIAGMMVSFLTNYQTNVLGKASIRSVPFVTQYFLPLDLKN